MEEEKIKKQTELDKESSILDAKELISKVEAALEEATRALASAVIEQVSFAEIQAYQVFAEKILELSPEIDTVKLKDIFYNSILPHIKAKQQRIKEEIDRTKQILNIIVNLINQSSEQDKY